MKKLLLLTMLILGVTSFARDFEYNEKRDIVKPMEENIDRLSRFTPQEWQMDKEATEMNFKKYEDFHKELERTDKGEESER